MYLNSRPCACGRKKKLSAQSSRPDGLDGRTDGCVVEHPKERDSIGMESFASFGILTFSCHPFDTQSMPDSIRRVFLMQMRSACKDMSEGKGWSWGSCKLPRLRCCVLKIDTSTQHTTHNSISDRPLPNHSNASEHVPSENLKCSSVMQRFASRPSMHFHLTKWRLFR
jgi:hypothetical protein